MDETVTPDERLDLVFCCCHPALSLDAQVALTPCSRRTTDEIAAALLVSPETMKRRLSRAKVSVKAAGGPLRGAHRARTA